jgi:hypothetical protein
MLDAADCSETLVSYENTRCHSPEDSSVDVTIMFIIALSSYDLITPNTFRLSTLTITDMRVRYDLGIKKLNIEF